MKLFHISAAIVAIGQSVSAVTIYLAGDSTMAKNGGGSGTDGWGNYFAYSVTGATVSNQAIGGRSARSFTREGRFQTIINAVTSGDFVVIEFGHNDGGSLSTDNGRTDCPGSGDETCQTTYNGVQETVLTFPKYLENAAAAIKAKGGKVVMSSQTPNNPWESGTFSYAGNRFVGYAQLAASVSGSAYVDHGQYTANIFQTKGYSVVTSYFPNDHTHTSPAGADTVSKAFVKGVLCGGLDLARYIKNSTSSVEGSCI